MVLLKRAAWAAMKVTEFESYIRGYHAYQDINLEPGGWRNFTSCEKEDYFDNYIHVVIFKS